MSLAHPAARRDPRAPLSSLSGCLWQLELDANSILLHGICILIRARSLQGARGRRDSQARKLAQQGLRQAPNPLLDSLQGSEMANGAPEACVHKLQHCSSGRSGYTAMIFWLGCVLGPEGKGKTQISHVCHLSGDSRARLERYNVIRQLVRPAVAAAQALCSSEEWCGMVCCGVLWCGEVW